MDNLLKESNSTIKKKSNSYYQLDSIDMLNGIKFNVFLYDKTIVKLAITIYFKSYISFRITEESYLLDYFDDRSFDKSKVMIFEQSTYKNELENISCNFAVSSSQENPKHFGIFYLCDECIEVISYDSPIIEYFNDID